MNGQHKRRVARRSSLRILDLEQRITPVVPPNDLVENAIAITAPAAGGTTTSTPINTLQDATENGNSTAILTTGADPLFNGTARPNTVWYTLTPTVSGNHTINTAGPATPALMDTQMNVGTLAGGTFTLLTGGFNDDISFPTNPRSQVNVSLVSGTTYHIQVGTYYVDANPASQGDLQLTVVGPVPPPPNDTAAGAIPLTLNLPVTGTTANATNDYTITAANPPFVGVGQTTNTAPDRDVVYSFTAPAAGSYSFRVQGTATFNPVIYVATALPGGPPPQAVPTASILKAANRNATTALGTEEVSDVVLTAGQQVFIVVDGATATVGNTFRLTAEATTLEATSNDTPATAGPLSFGVTGTISPAAEADFFSLGTPVAGARVFAMIDGLASNENDFDLRVTTATDTLEYDDLNGSANGSLSPVIAGTPLTGVASYLRVNHFLAGIQSEPYRLYSVIQTGAAVAEDDNNATLATAFVDPGNYFSGTAAGGDTDIFATRAAAGDVLFVALDGDPDRNNTPANFTIALLDSAGNVILNGNDVGSTSNIASGAGSLTATNPQSPGEGLVFRVTTPGRYYVRVTSSSAANNYLLSISKNGATGGGLAVNTTPTLDDPADTAVNEDPGLVTIPLTGIGAGGSDVGQALAVTAISSNPGLTGAITVNHTSPNTTGNLSFTPTANAFGTATITVRVTDDGGTPGVSPDDAIDDKFFEQTFTFTVNAVADTPSITAASTNEDTPTTSGLVVSRNVADGAEVAFIKVTGIVGGTLALTVGGTPVVNNDFVPVADAQNGFTFTPTADFNSATNPIGFNIQASLTNSDAGLGGAVVPASVTVIAVNDTPTLNDPPDQNVLADQNPHAVPLTGISAGPNEAAQGLVFTASSSNTLLIPNANITFNYTSGPTGTLNFNTAAGQSGSAVITVTLTDDNATPGNTADDLFVQQTFNVVVRPRPTVTFDDGDADDLVRGGVPLTYTLQFSEAVSGLTLADLTTVSTASASATFSNLVAVDADTYTVSVLPSGDGTIRVGLNSTANVVNGIGDPVLVPVSDDTPVAVDSTPPAVTVDPLFTNDPTPVITGTTELGSTVSVTVNMVTYTATVSGTTWSATVTNPLTTGTYEVTAQATDFVGNVGTDTSTDELVIDNTPPNALSLNGTSPPPIYVNTPTVTYTVTFDEPVLNVTAANFSLVQQAGGNSTIGTVSGSGTTWTIVVNTGTVDGFVRLNLSNTAGILDLAGNPLANTLVGETYVIDKTTPVITSNGGGAAGTQFVQENVNLVTNVTTVQPDNGSPITFSLTGPDAALFTISPTGALTFVTAPDVENPADAGGDNVYNVTVTASDAFTSDVQALTVNVTGQSEFAPVFTSGSGATAAVSVDEGTMNVYTATATDADLPGDTLLYSFAGGADVSKFTIDPVTGVLAFVTPPDADIPGDAGGNNVYDVQIRVSDGTFITTQSVAVTVDNVVEAVLNTFGGQPGGFTSGTQTTNQGTPVVFSGATAFAVDAADYPIVQATLTAANGTLTLSGTAGLTFSFSDVDGSGAGDGTADATMTFRGSAAAVNAALAGLTYTPNATFSGTATVTLGTKGIGNGPTVADTDFVFVIVDDTVADAPTITGTVADQAVNDNAAISPFATILIADPDTASLTTTVTFAAANGTFSNAGGFTASPGSLTYVGTAAETQAALRALVFNPTDNQVPVGSTVTTTFTVDVSDGTTTASDSNTTVVATSVPGANGLPFLDDFDRADDDNLGDEFQVVRGGFAIVGNEASVTAKKSLAVLREVSVVDVSVEADVTLGVGKKQVGLALRAQGAQMDTFYWGGIQQSGGKNYAVIFRVVNGKAKRLDRAIVPDGNATLRFEAVGTSLKLYLNDDLVAEATNDKIVAAGTVGLYSKGKIGARFDNFAVEELAPPIVAPRLAAATTAEAPVVETPAVKSAAPETRASILDGLFVDASSLETVFGKKKR